MSKGGGSSSQVFPEEVQRCLNEIATLWNGVEGHLKKAERVRLEVVITAVNELRYGGRLAVDAISIAADTSLSEDAKKQKIWEKVNEIKHNCVRAHADATDALVLFFHEHLALNEEVFGISLLMTHFPQYAGMKSKIREINDFMALSREDRLKRQEIYENINTNHLPTLETFYEQMLAVSDDLIAELNRNNRHTKWTDFFGKYGFYLALIGLLAAIYLGFAPAMHWWPYLNG